MKEESLKHLFEVAGRECGHWLSRANALKRGADLILDDLNKSLAIYPYSRAPYEELALFLPYMLLSGYALENLVKGILVEKDPSIVSNGEFNRTLVKGSKDGHISLEMVEQVVTDLSAPEKDLLKRLRQFIRWESRYPIPLKSDEMEPAAFRQSDPVLIDQLFIRMTGIIGKRH